MDKNLLKEAYRLRFEYYNFFGNKESKWHEKYKNHKLYNVVQKSFDFDYKQIGQIMPKLIKEDSTLC